MTKRHNTIEDEEVEPEDFTPKTMRRIEEKPAGQGQFSATGQTIKLTDREVEMKGKRKITCMLLSIFIYNMDNFSIDYLCLIIISKIFFCNVGPIRVKFLLHCILAHPEKKIKICNHRLIIDCFPGNYLDVTTFLR